VSVMGLTRCYKTTVFYIYKEYALLFTAWMWLILSLFFCGNSVWAVFSTCLPCRLFECGFWQGCHTSL